MFHCLMIVEVFLQCDSVGPLGLSLDSIFFIFKVCQEFNHAKAFVLALHGLMPSVVLFPYLCGKTMLKSTFFRPFAHVRDPLFCHRHDGDCVVQSKHWLRSRRRRTMENAGTIS